MPQTINYKIQRKFSESALSYDRFSGLHREIADHLLAQVIKKGDSLNCPLFLLDIGCGTGYLTGKVKDCFPQSKVIGLDIAQGMLEVARSKHGNITWVLADSGHLPFLDGSFDILTSNLAYQWAGDLVQSLTEARRVLLPGGVLALTLFGYHTCQELFQCLDEARPGALQFARLPDLLQVRNALAASGFDQLQVEGEQITIEFNGMQELLAWLKSIGANNLLREGFLGPEVISRAASIYRKKFSNSKGVSATFEVIQVYAKK